MATWSSQVEKRDPAKKVCLRKEGCDKLLVEQHSREHSAAQDWRISWLRKISAIAALEYQQKEQEMPLLCASLHKCSTETCFVSVLREHGWRKEQVGKDKRFTTSSSLVAIEKCGESITSEQSKLSYTAAGIRNHFHGETFLLWLGAVQPYFCKLVSPGMWQRNNLPDEAPTFEDFTKEGSNFT